MSISVMVADDHVLMREGLVQLLEFDGSIHIVAEASDGQECLDKLYEIKPQVLLLDINMPKKDGIEVLTELKQRKDLDVKILMLTVHNTGDYLMKAIDIGADGYLLKDAQSSELKSAIFAVSSGETYIQPSLIPLLENEISVLDEQQAVLETLTSREIEVLILVAQGLINKEIAYKLEISERTVKNHISNIFRKIDVFDRTQAAIFAIKNNLIKL